MALADAAGHTADIHDESAVRLAPIAETAGDPERRRLAWWCSSAVYLESTGRRAGGGARRGVGRSPRWFRLIVVRGTADHRGYGWSPGADFPLRRRAGNTGAS
ncbi:hypothetical protein ABLN97_00850 [Mycobacterium tuberculosis]